MIWGFPIFRNHHVVLVVLICSFHSIFDLGSMIGYHGWTFLGYAHKVCCQLLRIML